MAQLSAGDIDFFAVPGAELQTAEKVSNIKIESDLGLNYSYIGWNQKNELFKSKKSVKLLPMPLIVKRLSIKC